MGSLKKKTWTKIILYTIFGLIILFFIFPILWVLSLSFKTVPELYRIPPNILPDFLQWDSYLFLIRQTRILDGIWTSFRLVSATVIGTLIITLPASYCFSRMSFKGNKTILFIVLMFQMISPLVVVIPLYQYFARIGLLDSFWGLVMIYIALAIPFQVWFLKGFIDTIPIELDEAARIDGCNRLEVLIRVLLPVIVPGLFSGIMLIFISSWAQFIVPFIMVTTPSLMPVSAMLVNLQDSLVAITTHYLSAASIMAILPTIILFVVLQRYIVSALTAGAVKG